MSNLSKTKKSPKEAIFNVLRQISYTKLFKKYSSGDFSFNKISINNLVFNENCLVVARFKDFLIYDDSTEFFRRFYKSKDIMLRLNKILSFYEKYSKIFPNYLVLKENKYLYRNIRKKQKMIDAFNEIKREEKENRRKLKNNAKEKGKNGLNELFTKRIKNEIKAYQNNISFKNYKNSFDSDKNNDDTLLINQNSISIYYKQLNEENNEDQNLDSFITNQTNGSISNIVNVLNDNKIYTKDLPNILAQNNTKIIYKKNKNIKKGAKIKSKNAKVPRKKEKEIMTIQNQVNILDDIYNKDENENLSPKIIKNNFHIDKKKNSDKKDLYKNAFTSSNATNSSSIISKKIKNRQNSSSLNKNSKEKNENKNNINISIQNSKVIKDNNNCNNSDKNIITSKMKITNNYNLYQKTSPNSGNFGLQKNFYKTNSNFKKTYSNKSSKNINENGLKINIDKKSNKNTHKEKYKINKEIVKKKYIKTKNISQDFDSELIYKMTENILSNNNKIDSNENYKDVINTENNQNKNFLINDNPNLITGDTKPNERNEKNFMEDKVFVNVRDMIKQERENGNEIKSKSKKIFYTAQKIKKVKDNSLYLTKKKNNLDGSAKELKFYKTKKYYLNTIDNNKLNNKKAIDILNEDITSNNNIRNNSELTKQKTEIKILNKKIMSKEQKTKTKAFFTKNINKNADDKKLLIKSSENFYKTKNFFQKKEDKEKNNKNKEKDNKFKEKNIKYKEKDNHDKNKDNILKEKDNKIKENNKELNTNKSNKLYAIKYESTLFSHPTYSRKNMTIKKMTTNLSDANIKQDFENISQNIKQPKNLRTKIHISKNNKIMHLNKSVKSNSEYKEKKYKSFLMKNKNNLNNESNYNSQKNLLSINILHRIKEVKQNKSNNDFYRTIKAKNWEKINNINNSNSIINSNKNILYNNRAIKTPIMKKKKTTYFKNCINKRIKDDIGSKTKEEMNQNYMSSFSIKVNKSTYNKDKEKIQKKKNLKKTWTKNTKFNAFQSYNIPNEIK